MLLKCFNVYNVAKTTSNIDGILLVLEHEHLYPKAKEFRQIVVTVQTVTVQIVYIWADRSINKILKLQKWLHDFIQSKGDFTCCRTNQQVIHVKYNGAISLCID